MELLHEANHETAFRAGFGRGRSAHVELRLSISIRYRPPRERTEVTRLAHISGWGWSTPDPFDLEEMCPEGVARFGSEVTVLNWLPAFFTLGIYSPRTVIARCAAVPEVEPK